MTFYKNYVNDKNNLVVVARNDDPEILLNKRIDKTAKRIARRKGYDDRIIKQTEVITGSQNKLPYKRYYFKKKDRRGQR